MTAEELAAWQAAHPEDNQEVAIGEDDSEQADEYTDTDPSALTEFKPALDGHGEWVEDATYGTVWKPSAAEVGTDFQPYVTAGHWTYADDTDYVWVSDYSWGWAPFHYGRWVVLPNHGWTWIPGRRYAGAWVSWRTSPGYGYIGWAPAPPEYYWYNGYATGWSFGFYRYHDHYSYCHRDQFFYGGNGGVRQYTVRGPAAQVHYERTVEYAPPAQRVAAAPTVNQGGGRIAARPTVSRPGPKPDTLGMGKDSIVAPPSGGGLDRARTLAVPSTAVASGARAPLRPASIASQRGPSTTASIPRTGPSQPSFRASPSVNPPGVGSRPSFGTPGSNQLPSGGGRVAAAPSRPTFSQPSGASVASPSFRPSSPSVGAARPTFSQPSSAPRASTPSFRPSAPSVQRAPSFSQPSSAPRASTPSFRPSAPSVQRAPSFSQPSGASRSSPSFRPSSPSVSRPSGGGSRAASPSVRRR